MTIENTRRTIIQVQILREFAVQIIMNSTQIYAIITDDIFATTILYNIISKMWSFLRLRTLFFLLKHLVYSYVLQRRRFLSFWTRHKLFLQIIYWTETAICNAVEIKNLNQASFRADTLIVIQFISLLLDSHLSFVADLLETFLHIWRQFHSSMKLMILSLNVFHVAAALSDRERFFFRNKVHLYEFMISSILICHFTSLTLLHYAEGNIHCFAAIVHLIIDAKILVWNFPSISSSSRDHDSSCVMTSSLT